ncbi:MAG: hypothetical protein ACD_79C00201G0003 [uncultured bacterium]|nr:MAG: hypothetical protein ACD_79C00201G0003 [uncultured bacterium]
MNYMYGINYNAPSGLWFTRLCSGTGLNPVLQYHALSGQKATKRHYAVTMGIAHQIRKQILYETQKLKKSVMQKAFAGEL